eukprot:GFUD01033368.1.p1 GENE.GFUD01033368.1~~GFUD01033368.1.p1  ORF type:complete len:211 (-),score=74.51 GFUD01033368.1:160-792(-)
MSTACVPDCRPGEGTDCPNYKLEGNKGNVSCLVVEEMLRKMDVDPSKASLCVKAAIMRGHIKISGEKDELKMVVSKGELQCGHRADATLEQLLAQSDYGGHDMELLENAKVICPSGVEDDEWCDEEWWTKSGVKGTTPGGEECGNEGRAYVTGMCDGDPSFNCGKSHNHCVECPGYGTCIYDYRECHCDNCGGHYFGGSYESYECPCGGE